MSKPCRHLNTRVHGGNRIGYGSCPDCGKEINLSEVFDNWLNELRQVKAEVVGRKTLLAAAEVKTSPTGETYIDTIEDDEIADEDFAGAAAAEVGEKDKPAIDPNIIYPGSDLTNVFPEEEP